MAVSIRQLQENELSAANHIFRLAFGTFIQLPDPMSFASDRNYMNRWYLDPTAAFAAIDQEQIVGSNIAANWGSFGTFGPLTVHPNYWGCKVGQQLVEAVVGCFERWQVSQAGLFTFSDSAKHLMLYQKFGFYPRFLTTVMSKSVQPAQANALSDEAAGMLYSQLDPAQQTECLKSCFQLTDAIYSGLDASREMVAVASQNLGDTVLLHDGDRLKGFAVCHCGEGSEAGKDNCFVKFGAVQSKQPEADFERLLQSCERFARQQGLKNLVGGVNTERQVAYQKMLSMGFRIEMIGAVLAKPNQPGFNRPDVFVLDDWR